MRVRRGVSNALFAGTAVVLLIIAGIGFSLYLTSGGVHTTTENMTETTTTGTTETQGNHAIQFSPTTGQMIHSGWLLVQPAGSGQYAVSIHAEGLENTQTTDSIYIVEAELSSGSMPVVPIGPNETSSEFGTTSSGIGSYFILLNQNPYTSFDKIMILYVPGMQMSNATVVATAALH